MAIRDRLRWRRAVLRVTVAGAGVGLCLAALGAPAYANDPAVFMQVPKVMGSSTVGKSKGWLELRSFALSVTAAGTPDSSGFVPKHGVAGQATAAMDIGMASVSLISDVGRTVKGDVLVEFLVSGKSGLQEPYLKYTFQDASFVSYTLQDLGTGGGAATGGSAESVEVVFDCSSITVQYTSQNGEGSGPPGSFSLG